MTAKKSNYGNALIVSLHQTENQPSKTHSFYFLFSVSTLLVLLTHFIMTQY